MTTEAPPSDGAPHSADSRQSADSRPANGGQPAGTSRRHGPDAPPTDSHPPHSRQARQDRKATVLTHGSASVVSSITDAVVVKRGEPFFLCPPDGGIPTSGHHGFGLYHHDTRFLSGYELRVAGIALESLAAATVTGSKAVLELTNPPLDLADGRRFGKERLGVRWTRELHDDPPRLVDRVDVRNYAAEQATLPIDLTFAADFQDLFAIRGLLRERPGTLHHPAWDGDRLVFRYDGKDGVIRRLTVGFSDRPSKRDGTSVGLVLDVDGHAEASVEVRLTIDEELQPGAAPIEHRTAKGHRPSHDGAPRTARGTEAGGRAGGGPDWRTSVRSDALALDGVIGRSLADLRTLRDRLDGHRYYAAGVPWFSTLFGRDSLIAAYQTLAFEPDVAAETLRLLASLQGTKDDDWRDEEPGKILHELRVGELARLHEIPHTPYYGSIDSTPLFLLVLARHASWTGSLDLFRELRSNVDRALQWIARSIDRGGGYVAYDSTTKHGLVNQGWKDSGDAIVNADGSTADPPIALAEVQGYVFAAKRELALLFDRDGDAGAAARLRREADELRARFETDFWSDDLGCYVLALQKDRRPCAVVTSNAGQVLWSGIASDQHAGGVAKRLFEDDVFDGWGIRTLSSKATAYNPVGYHLGTVWPHDNGLIAEGLRRYGNDADAERILVALVEASTDFAEQRLPECFAGFDRSTFGTPVRYPIACHPQAWAAGATPHLLTTTLGLVPEAFERRLRVVRPRLPDFVQEVDVAGIPVADARVDLSFRRDGERTDVTVGHVEGDLDVEIEA